MNFVSTLGIFVFFILFLLSNVVAVPPGVGTVTQITDVKLPDTMYMGKNYYIHAIAKDVSNDPVVNTSCAVSSYVGDQYIDRKDIKDWCKFNLDCLPATALPFECYYTTWGNGHILIPFYIDPALYETGVTYTFILTCEDVTVSDTATIVGVSDGSCNVSSVSILDGSGSTVDGFDEAPNKFDSLIIPFSLESYNVPCIDKEVFYKVQKDVNGTYVDFMPLTSVISDVNGTGTASFEVDGSFVTDGKYRVVLFADDKTDSTDFVVNIPRDLFAPKDIEWYRQPIFIAIIMVVIIVGMFVFFRSQ